MASNGRSRDTNTTRKGRKLEIYAEQLFKELGKWFVKRNVYYSFRSLVRDRVVRRVQVDVKYYDLYGKTIVECKYYDAWRVSAQDVQDFKKKIDLIRPSTALIVTNNTLTEEGEVLARRFGIRVYDHDELQRLDYERKSLVGMVMQNLGKRRKTLEEQLQEIDLRSYDSNRHYHVTQYVLF